MTPRSVWWRRPRESPSTSLSIACGWSPVGSKGATRRKVGHGAMVAPDPHFERLFWVSRTGRRRHCGGPAPRVPTTRTAARTGTNGPFAPLRPGRRLRRSSTSGGSSRPRCARPRPTASAPAGARTPSRRALRACPTAPRGRTVAGRVLADPHAPAVHPARDHPVRLHLQLGRHPVDRRPRGGPRRLDLRLRPQHLEAGQRHRAEQQGQDHAARVDERPHEDEPPVLHRDHVDERHERDDDAPTPTATS